MKDGKVRATAAIVAASMAAACGFQLEGTGALPTVMQSTYVETVQPHSEFFESLRNALRIRGSRVVGSPSEAAAVLHILEDSTGQRVLSVSARNTPREYEVFYAVTFSVQVGGTTLIEPESMVLTRSYTYDERQVLGKSAEEQTLREALAADLARQVVRRIESRGAMAAVQPQA